MRLSKDYGVKTSGQHPECLLYTSICVCICYQVCGHPETRPRVYADEVGLDQAYPI